MVLICCPFVLENFKSVCFHNVYILGHFKPLSHLQEQNDHTLTFFDAFDQRLVYEAALMLFVASLSFITLPSVK